MWARTLLFFFFFFNDTATTEIYTLSLHDALPIGGLCVGQTFGDEPGHPLLVAGQAGPARGGPAPPRPYEKILKLRPDPGRVPLSADTLVDGERRAQGAPGRTPLTGQYQHLAD